MTGHRADPNPAATKGRDPRTEEQIQAAWVEKIEPLTGPITFVEYDAEWPALFALEEARIRAVLGDRVVDLEHTGSTSVPGLAAKPVIDITMTVADATDEPAYVPDLEAAGYRLVIREREPDWYEHRVFKGPDTNVNLQCSRWGHRSWSGWSGCATGFGRTMRIGTCARRPSATSSAGTGTTSRTMPTRRARASRRSPHEPDSQALARDTPRLARDQRAPVAEPLR